MTTIMEKPKLKPVVYTRHWYKQGAPNATQQALLLKAMQVTSDPKKLKEMIGVKTVAEVYRTLDKLQIRKDYHRALAQNDVTLDLIVRELKDIAVQGEKDGDRIKALQTLLKSVGLEKYETVEEVGGNWEEALLKAVDKKKDEEISKLPAGNVTNDEIEDYEVVEPKTPNAIAKMQEEEREMAKSIYE